MTELLTADGMRAIEGAAISSGAVTGLELMERAGRGVVDAICAEWPDMAEGNRRAVVLCGPGNNGGDGFVVARLLKERGWEAEVFLYGDPAKLPPDARANHDRWSGPVRPLDDHLRPSEHAPDLIVDALFGTGLTRPVEGLGPVLRDVAEMSGTARVVAVDLPSGLCSDSGRVLETADGSDGGAVRADLTVTFHGRKLGHVLADGPAHAGRVVVADIGL